MLAGRRVAPLFTSSLHLHFLRSTRPLISPHVPAVRVTLQQRNAHTHTHTGDCCGHSHELSEGEKKIYDKLVKELDTEEVRVIDTSGGCGSMYRVEVISKKFNGKGLLDQHKMVNEVLKEDIAKMHGISIKTKAA